MNSIRAKGLHVLKRLAREQRICSVSNVADALGLERRNVHRTLHVQRLLACAPEASRRLGFVAECAVA